MSRKEKKIFCDYNPPWRFVENLCVGYLPGYQGTFLQALEGPGPLVVRNHWTLYPAFRRTWAFWVHHRWTHKWCSCYRCRSIPQRSKSKSEQLAIALTCTTACLPLISRTWPFLMVPFPSLTLTISAYFGNLTLSRITSGPSTSRTVL